jgi:hypothetical protein
VKARGSSAPQLCQTGFAGAVSACSWRSPHSRRARRIGNSSSPAAVRKYSYRTGCWLYGSRRRIPAASSRYVVRGDAANLESRDITFDVVTEMAWDDRAGFETWITRLGVPAVAEDEARFLDRSKTKAYLITERVSAT